jgi:hypothetical protein
MRCLPFLPLAFLAGIHGFVFFAPYLIAFAAMDHLIARHRQPGTITRSTPGAGGLAR